MGGRGRAAGAMGEFRRGALVGAHLRDSGPSWTGKELGLTEGPPSTGCWDGWEDGTRAGAVEGREVPPSSVTGVA